jgi:hypothetical protein
MLFLMPVAEPPFGPGNVPLLFGDSALLQDVRRRGVCKASPRAVVGRPLAPTSFAFVAGSIRRYIANLQQGILASTLFASMWFCRMTVMSR